MSRPPSRCPCGALHTAESVLTIVNGQPVKLCAACARKE